MFAEWEVLSPTFVQGQRISKFVFPPIDDPLDVSDFEVSAVPEPPRKRSKLFFQGTLCRSSSVNIDVRPSATPDEEYVDSPNSTYLSGNGAPREKKPLKCLSASYLDAATTQFTFAEVEYTLPTIPSNECKSSSSAFRYISKDTLAEQLKFHGEGFSDIYVLIDCRYKYEYQGGHVKNAINFTDPKLMAAHFFPEDPEQFSVISKKIPIFYCEYSEVRGPRMAGALRSKDRERHYDDYPWIDYQEIYVLHGGYRAFYGATEIVAPNTRSLCVPEDYVAMDHPAHKDKLKLHQAHRPRNAISRKIPASTSRAALHGLLLKLLMESLSIDVDVKIEPSHESQSSSSPCAACGLNEDGIENTSFVECDECKKWYHVSCVDADEMTTFAINKFHCPTCEETVGKSVFYELLVPHRHNYFNIEEMDEKTQVGSKKWIEDFILRENQIPPFPVQDTDVNKFQVHLLDNGYALQYHFNGTTEWKHVFIIKHPIGLKLELPPPDFKIEDALNVMGPHTHVDTIDVYRQATKTMRLDRFVAEWKKEERPRLYNILSMEFSKSQLRHYFKQPKLVRDLSWVSLYWPAIPVDLTDITRDDLPEVQSESSGTNPAIGFTERKMSPRSLEAEFLLKEESDHWPKVHEEDYGKRPTVELFCLIGMKGSYTDFHIDFGGSSVYYHIFRGKKIFYYAPPTDEVLEIYRNYSKDNKRHEEWLGDQLRAINLLFRAEIEEGQTLLIPSGWLHAVYTPVDSIVFGGNFLHKCNISMQLRVNDIEEEANIDEKFMFPDFRLCNWYAAKAITEEIQECNKEHELCPEHIYRGSQDLLEKLYIWYEQDKDQLDKFGRSIIGNLEKELKSQKKLRAKKKRRSEDEFGVEIYTDDLDKKRPRKHNVKKSSPVLIPQSSTANTEVANGDTDHSERCDAAKPETDSSGLKLVIRRESLADSAPVEIPPLKINALKEEKDQMSSMFSAPASSGRRRKPTAIAKDFCGEELAITAEAVAVEKSLPDYSEEMDRIVHEEAHELQREERKKKNSKKNAGDKLKEANKGLASQQNGSSKPAPKMATAKQRLAKKLKL